MPFEDTYCEREGCGHNVPSHPNDGPCKNCNCVGFFANHGYIDPLADFYTQKIIDIHVAFKNDLDTAKHMVNDFPIMALKFFQEKDENVKEFWKKLAIEKPNLAEKVNKKIQLFNQQGREGMGKLDLEEAQIITELTHDGANYQRELVFIQKMILSFFTTRFREFIKELLILIFEIEFKHKRKHKSLTHEELETKAIQISDMDIKNMLKEFSKKWNLDLRKLEDSDQFIEFFYRRNVVIHNNGYPNKKYREKTRYAGSDQRLEVNNGYLLRLIQIFYSYSDIINEHFLETECNMVNITKKGNSHHIDLTEKGGRIIPVKDKPQ